MLEILTGAFSGIFSGIGMGGGTILIFLLTTFVNIEQHIAQATNLIYFVPTAISAIVVNYKNKNLDLKIAFNISFWGIVGAIIGSIISVNTDVSTLKKYFGIFLLIFAILKLSSSPYLFSFNMSAFPETTFTLSSLSIKYSLCCKSAFKGKLSLFIEK